MNPIFYLLIPLVLFTILLYPLLRKIVSLLEIFINKYIQQTINTKEVQPSPQQTLIHLKLLAYERIVLLIERLKPESLIPRTFSPHLSYKEYQLLILNEIRKEFEYNLSQQIYVSENAWTVTVNFKNNMITLINSVAAECTSNDKANQLAQKILERYITSDLKADQILKVIKQEVEN